jgi:hypothetical protein
MRLFLARPQGFGRTTPFAPTAVYPKIQVQETNTPPPTRHMGFSPGRHGIDKIKNKDKAYYDYK